MCRKSWIALIQPIAVLVGNYMGPSEGFLDASDATEALDDIELLLPSLLQNRRGERVYRLI